jgi:hypothetical protein
MRHPDDILLPFFAYGIFKPKQLCFGRISDLVKATSACTVRGALKERDGLPLLVLGNTSSRHIKGYLIHFHAGQETEAYNRIVAVEPDEVYYWGTVEVNGFSANALLGKSPNKGSADLEHCDDWDGRADPFFKQGLEEVKAILDSNREFDWEFKALLRLHMAYFLLWSAIERYTGLKYHLGTRATEKVMRLIDEECFADALKRHVKEQRAPVYSTTKPATGRERLDPANPKNSLEYYYQVRSNAIHRGKASRNDFDTLRKSLEELLAIFREVLDSAFAGE